jgi:hypothetical protein
VIFSIIVSPFSSDFPRDKTGRGFRVVFPSSLESLAIVDGVALGIKRPERVGVWDAAREASPPKPPGAERLPVGIRPAIPAVLPSSTIKYLNSRRDEIRIGRGRTIGADCFIPLRSDKIAATIVALYRVIPPGIRAAVLVA